MKFDIYGRFRIEVVHDGGRWIAYRLEPGKRIRAHDLVFPESLEETDIAIYLDDLFHEMAGPGQTVQEIT
jgi:hypothetical protein